jgi:hypothetical protein
MDKAIAADHQPLRLYFAYGSNLCREQMAAPVDTEAVDRQYRNRCPDSVPIAAYRLSGWRLEFVGERTGRWGRGGVATIVPESGSSVSGALYRLSPADERALDGFENIDENDPKAGSYRKIDGLFTFNGEPVFTYVATSRLAPVNNPNERYLNTLRRGYSQWGLPLAALARFASYPAEDGAPA